jgi:phage tail protein X
MNRYKEINLTLSEGKKSVSGRRIFTTVKYPNVPLLPDDIYVYAEEGDRYDQLALSYYGDASLWWIISIANSNLPQNSYFLPLGVQVRIPQNIGAIQTQYYKLNHRNEL